MDEFETLKDNCLKITEYKVLGELPDPFLFDNGNYVKTENDWYERKKEIYKTAIELQYGTQPPKPEFLEVETLYTAKDACVYKIHTGTYKNPISFRMQVFLPTDKGEKFPFIIDGDGCWMYHTKENFVFQAVKNGVGMVYFDRTELAHDIYHEERGQGDLYKVYPEYTFGSLGAWAWGYSRCIDALEKLNLPVDFDYLTITGHSRGGKTCALAGALDDRVKIVNPNETCAGACGCYRIQMQAIYENEPEFRSEKLKDLLTHFPQWMGPEMGKYIDCEEKLPFDTHFLKAMIAPRILFVSEAAGDIWSNPIGSYITSEAAREVYKFLGAEDNLYWYFRPGLHAHKPLDLYMLVNLIKHRREGTELSERMFKLPFTAPEQPYKWRCPDK